MPNGDPVCNFSIADSQGKEKPTIWWNCQLFGKRAETLSQYLLKGQAVTVTGNVTKRTYTDKNGAEKVSTDIRVGDVALQGGKKESEPRQEKSAPKKQAPRPASGFDDMEDDCPF